MTTASYKSGVYVKKQRKWHRGSIIQWGRLSSADSPGRKPVRGNKRLEAVVAFPFTASQQLLTCRQSCKRDGLPRCEHLSYRLSFIMIRILIDHCCDQPQVMMFKTIPKLSLYLGLLFYCLPVSPLFLFFIESINKFENVIKCSYCVQFSDTNNTNTLCDWCPKEACYFFSPRGMTGVWCSYSHTAT